MTVIAAPNDERLGWRLNEFCKLVNLSRATLRRMADRGDLKLIYFGGAPLVPRAEAIRLGLIAA